jgi:hypothetical protein
VGKRIVKNLDVEVWPDYEMVWGNLVKWKPPPGDQGSEPHLRSTSDTKAP